MRVLATALRGDIIAYASWKKKQSQIEKLNLENQLKRLQEKHEKILIEGLKKALDNIEIVRNVMYTRHKY